MKILILGHGRHGKDTAAHFMAGLTGLEFQSSSMFACQKFISKELGYKSDMTCYRSRHSQRQKWYDLIKEYNTPDKSKLCRELLNEYDIYVGMRDNKEYEASKHLFDHIFWVDASERKPKDETMKIEYNEDEMTLIDNNLAIYHLFNQLHSRIFNL